VSLPLDLRSDDHLLETEEEGSEGQLLEGLLSGPHFDCLPKRLDPQVGGLEGVLPGGNALKSEKPFSIGGCLSIEFDQADFGTLEVGAGLDVGDATGKASRTGGLRRDGCARCEKHCDSCDCKEKSRTEMALMGPGKLPEH